MNKDSHNFNCTVLTYLNLDIIGVCETFLKNGETLNLNGYHWFGNNRTSLHQNARRGSGGVGAFVKTEILEQYTCATDVSMEDVIWLKFEKKNVKQGINLRCASATFPRRVRPGSVTVKHSIVTSC